MNHVVSSLFKVIALIIASVHSQSVRPPRPPPNGPPRPPAQAPVAVAAVAATSSGARPTPVSSPPRPEGCVSFCIQYTCKLIYPTSSFKDHLL